jgi:hypothetical protein
VFVGRVVLVGHAGRSLTQPPTVVTSAVLPRDLPDVLTEEPTGLRGTAEQIRSR